jgi:hypothetical protein
MSNILVNTIKDTGNNTLLSSDGSGSVTLGSGFPQNTPLFSVYRNGDQSLSSGASTKIQFDNINFNVGSNWDSSNYRFTATTAGYYSFKGSLGFQGTISRVILFFYKNSSEWQRGTDINITGATIVHGSTIMYLGVGDFCELYGYATGSSLSVRNQTETWFSGNHLIGA